MKKITKEFYQKIARNGGIYDTKAYRYVINSPTEVQRIRIEYLDTVGALPHAGNWEHLVVE